MRAAPPAPADVDAGGAAPVAAPPARYWRGDLSASARVGARFDGHSREVRHIDARTAGVQIEPALRELGQLGEAAADGRLRHGMLVQIFEQSANEIAHFDQRRLGQIIERADRAFRRGAGRRGDMRNPAGARDVDAAMNAVDPGGAGIGHDDSRRPQHGQAADNAEPAVERMFRHLLAAGNGNLDQRVRLDAKLPRRLRDGCPASSRAGPD